jgi:hypothetical protein
MATSRGETWRPTCAPMRTHAAALGQMSGVVMAFEAPSTRTRVSFSQRLRPDGDPGVVRRDCFRLPGRHLTECDKGCLQHAIVGYRDSRLPPEPRSESMQPGYGARQPGGVTGTIVFGEGAGWFAAGFTGPALTLLVAELDPVTGQPDLENGWQLEFTRAPETGSTAAREISPRSDSSDPDRGPSAAAGERSPLAQQWMQHLGGKRVTFISRGGGSGGGWQQRADYFLCSNGTFYYRESSSVAAEVPGVIGHAGGRDSGQGTWRVAERAGRAFVEYRLTDGTTGVAELEFREGGTYVDGTRAYVTDQNDVCS